jgi:translation initiation factor IF-2
MFEQLRKAASDTAASVIGTVTEPVRRIVAIPEQIRERKAAAERAAQLEREAAEERERLEREAAAERARQALRVAERRAFRERQARRKTTRRVAFYGFLGLTGFGACLVLAFAVVGMLTDRPIPTVPIEPLIAAPVPPQPVRTLEQVAATPQPSVIETAPTEPPVFAPIVAPAIEPAPSAALPPNQPSVIAESSIAPSEPPAPINPRSGFTPGVFGDPRPQPEPDRGYTGRPKPRESTADPDGTNWVKGYTRKDGTYVKPHESKNPSRKK